MAKIHSKHELTTSPMDLTADLLKEFLEPLEGNKTIAVKVDYPDIPGVAGTITFTAEVELTKNKKLY